MFRYISLVLFFLCTACVAGDAAFKIRGQIVDQNGALYEKCAARINYAGKLLEDTSIAGDFSKTIIFSAYEWRSNNSSAFL